MTRKFWIIYVSPQTRTLPVLVRGSAFPVLVTQTGTTSVYLLFQSLAEDSGTKVYFSYFGHYWQRTYFPVPVLPHLSHVCTSIGILYFLPVLVLSYLLFHNASTGTDLLPIPVWAYSLDAHTGIFPFVTRANTSMGIFVCLPVLVWSM